MQDQTPSSPLPPTRGGRRQGAGRPKGDSQLFAFRAGGELASSFHEQQSEQSDNRTIEQFPLLERIFTVQYVALDLAERLARPCGDEPCCFPGRVEAERRFRVPLRPFTACLGRAPVERGNHGAVRGRGFRRCSDDESDIPRVPYA